MNDQQPARPLLTSGARVIRLEHTHRATIIFHADFAPRAKSNLEPEPAGSRTLWSCPDDATTFFRRMKIISGHLICAHRGGGKGASRLIPDGEKRLERMADSTIPDSKR